MLGLGAIVRFFICFCEKYIYISLIWLPHECIAWNCKDDTVVIIEVGEISHTKKPSSHTSRAKFNTKPITEQREYRKTRTYTLVFYVFFFLYLMVCHR